MLRRTCTLAIAPLPLYKVAIVVGRQFSRPIVDYFLQGASDSPTLRKGFITIGWHYYQVSCHLHRMIWGAEQQEKKEAQEAKIKEALREEISASPIATPVMTTLKPEVKDNILNETTSSAPGIVDQQQQQQQQQELSNSKVLLNDDIPLTAATPADNPLAPDTPLSPRSLKLSSGPGFVYNRVIHHNPFKKVRNIFIAPPRPSDEELLKKGMKLVVEIILICFFCTLIGYEMYQTSLDKKEKRMILEQRFQRLEKHIVHFDGCGCEPGAKDGECPKSEEIDKGVKKWLGQSDTDKAVDSIVNAITGGSSSSTNDNNNQKKEGTTTTTSPSSTGNSGAASIGDKQPEGAAGEKKKDSIPAKALQAVAAVVKGGVSTTSGSSAAVKKGGEIARLPKNVSDLVALWTHLPLEVQCTVAAVFILPYTFMFLLVLRLFSLVNNQQRRMQTAS